MGAAYQESRPAYLGDTLDSIIVTIGVSLVGATFTAAMYTPDGALFGTPTVTITDPTNGIVSIVLPVVPLGSIPGLYRVTCNWVNNGNLLVSYGVVEYTDPVAQHS